MLDSLKSWFQSLIDKANAVVQWFKELFEAVFLALWDMLTDLICWVLEAFLYLIQTILNNLPGDMSIFNPGTYIKSLPPDFVNMLGLLRLGEALAIILAAILIKIILQLIPFTRLGS